MAAEPLVTVVIPTYNQASYLGEAIDSVLSQDYPRLELVVVDDGSTDDTPSIIASHGARIVAIRQPNQGAANALNRGIQAASGELICWLSSDDAFIQGKVRRQVEAFAEDPDLGLCFTGFEVVDATGTLRSRHPDIALIHPDLFVSVFWRNPLNGSTAMMPRHVYQAVGPFNAELRADVDGEMWLRVLSAYRVRHLPGVLLRYRVHAAAMSSNTTLMRGSKTAVRLARLRDGSLVAHLRAAAPPSAAATLAQMSLDFNRDSMPWLARELLFASLRQGLAPRLQWPAAVEVFRVARRRSRLLSRLRPASQPPPHTDERPPGMT